MIDIKNVKAICTATDYEKFCIWKQFHNEMKWDWQEDRVGCSVTLGYVNDMPVVISIIVDKVMGKDVLFIEDTSQVVDHRMIDKWREENLPNIPHQHAENFVNLFPER